MQLTKLTHSCVRVDTGAGVLVLDPGAYSEAAQALDGADACLITHLHADHLDAHAVAAALRAQPDLRVWAPASALDVLRAALGDHASCSTSSAPTSSKATWLGWQTDTPPPSSTSSRGSPASCDPAPRVEAVGCGAVS